MNMDFDTNKTPIEVINEGAFVVTYFRDIYSVINGKWYWKSLKECDELKNINQNYYCSNYDDVNVNKRKLKCRTPLRFGKIKIELIL